MAIAYIDAQVHIHAQTWYAARPTEPSGGLSLRVEQVESLSQMTLESLMDAILRTAPQRGDIIICCHAVNQTLAIRLLEGTETRARLEVIGPMASDRARVIDGLPMPAVTSQAVAQLAQLQDVQIVERLRSKMNRIRQLHLRHVGLRGCNIGRSTAALTAFKEFFGCQSLTGPDMRDTYGSVEPSDRADLTAWMAVQTRAHFHNWADGATGVQVAIATRGGDTDEDLRYTMRLAHQGAAALEAWSRGHLGRPPANPVVFHGLWYTQPAPGSPRIIFVGDREYNGHLISV